jgi:predicted aminopeptidase
VPAYSTLGWLSDPVLSSFVYDAEPELAEMMFHELAHVLLFVPGDTVFNESFAVTVAAEGLRRYTAAHPMDLGELQEAKVRQAQFVALVLDYRARLQTAFAAPATVAQKRAAKQQLYAALQADYVRLRTQWGGYAGYDNWFRQANNASMNTVATYYDEVPALQRLLAAGHNDLPTFYAACRRLAKMSPAARLAELKKS